MVATCSFVAAATGLSPLHAAVLASLEDGGGASLDVLLGAHTHHVGGNIDGLFADSDVFLEDEDAGVVDRVSEVALLDERLQSALQELRGGQTEHIIELALSVSQQTESDHSTDQGLTFEKSSGILLVHREQDTSSLSIRGR